jgi:hypothetical protein
VKNPRNRDFGRFGLQNQQYTIYCNSSYGPTFGNGHDLYIANGCNGNANSYTNLGTSYVNNTNIPGTQVFTGQQYFTVKEIEVFALTD